MAKQIVQPADMRCNKCGAQKFVIGKKYFSGNTASYVLRCACCIDGNGAAHMIKNVNEPYYNALVNLGRIYANPVSTGQVASPATDTNAVQNTLGTVGQVAPTTSEHSSMGTSAIPPAFQTQRPTGILPPDDCPFDTLTGGEQYVPPLPEEPAGLYLGAPDFVPGEPILYSERAVPPPMEPIPSGHPGVSQPIPHPPTPVITAHQPEMNEHGFLQGTVPPVATRVSANAVASTLNTGTSNAGNPNCALCKGHRAIKIPRSDYAMRLEGSRAEYYEELTGQILFQQALMYCPMCGGKL